MSLALYFRILYTLSNLWHQELWYFVNKAMAKKSKMSWKFKKQRGPPYPPFPLASLKWTDPSPQWPKNGAVLILWDSKTEGGPGTVLRRIIYWRKKEITYGPPAFFLYIDCNPDTQPGDFLRTRHTGEKFPKDHLEVASSLREKESKKLLISSERWDRIVSF